MYKNAEYALMSNKSVWDSPMVVQLSYPYVVGKPIVIAKDADEVSGYMEQIRRGMPCGKVNGFTIFVVPMISMMGDTIPKASLVRTMNEMAEFFREEIVIDHLGKYHRSDEDFDASRAERNERKAIRREQETQRKFEKAKKELFG